MKGYVNQMKKFSFKRKVQEPAVKTPTLDSFPDFTKKEIFTQGELINNLLARYIKAGKINFDYLKIKADKIKRIYIVGSGIDYSCAIFAAYNFEVLLDVISTPVSNGEFLCSNPILDKNTLIILLGEDERIVKKLTDTGARFVKIVDYSDDKSAITLNYKTLGSFQSAAYSMKLTVLSLLALYFGEKNQIITSLYVKIATQMISGLEQKIKHILAYEFIINEICDNMDFDNILFTGTNVDYAISIYAARILSCIANKEIAAVPMCELNPYQRNCKSVCAFASNIDFYNLFDINLNYQLKIISNSVNTTDDNTIFYDESIPLLNPILSAVVIQMISYRKLKNHPLQEQPAEYSENQKEPQF